MTTTAHRASASPQTYDLYRKRHDELLALARKQRAVALELGLEAPRPAEDSNAETNPAELLEALIARLESESLDALVVGRFSAGKSTFLNALFGQAILPASPSPTTGVLCEIRYADAESRSALLYPKTDIAADGNHEPFFIPVDQIHESLAKYVKIDHFGEKTEVSAYEKLVLRWPLFLCRHGVTVTDSVGLDDPDSRDAITLKHAQSADVILYCMKSQDAYSAKDKQVLTLLKALGYESIFFVITYYDHIWDSVALGQTTEEAFRKLMLRDLLPWTSLGEAGVKFVDSKQALLGRIHDDPDKVARSGIEEVERELESFLVNQKGVAKLATSLRSLKTVNHSLGRLFPARTAMLRTSLEELEQRYRNAELPLKNMEARRQLLVSQATVAIEDICKEGQSLATTMFCNFSEKIEEIGNNYTIQGSIGFPPRKSTLEPLVREVLDHLKDSLQSEILEWSQKTLGPMIQDRLQSMQQRLEPEAAEFFKAVDRLRLEISVGKEIDNQDLPDAPKPSPWGRIFAGGYVILTGDIVSGGTGMMLGFKAMVRTIVCQIVAGVLLAMFGLLNPVSILIAAIAAIATGSYLNIFSLKKNIAKSVAQRFAEALLKNRIELVKQVEAQVREKLNEEIKTPIGNSMAAEISGIRNEIESMLQTRKAGQLDTDKQLQNLSRLEKENTELRERLDALLLEAGLS